MNAPPVLRVGCPMWANRAWVGRYLPARTRPGDELAAYATWCNAVEANTTFYATPARAAVERWAEQVPDDFRFVCKLPRAITHERRLREPAEVGRFLEALEPLGDRIGLGWVQLPASFAPDELPVLQRFLRALDPAISWAVEVRHPSFSDGGSDERALNEALYEAGTDRVLFDTRALFAGPCETTDEIEAFERKPRLPVRPVALGRHPVVRFLGQTDEAANPAYWRRWVPKLAEWLSEGREPYWFMHTPDNATSPGQARAVHAAVAEALGELEPLPEPMVEPDQLKLL